MFFSGSFAVIADGIDSSADIVSSIVTLIAARVVLRPPNIKFPYGYVKADTVATKTLSMLIFIAGSQLAISTIQKISRSEIMETPAMLAIYVTIFSIAGKLALSIYLRSVGKNQKMEMLTTMGLHMISDMLISITVLIGLIGARLFDLPMIDKIVALVISVYIMYAAIRIFMKSNVELMDGIDDPRLYQDVFKAVSKVPGAYNPHRTRARKIGSHYMINLDIEVDPKMSVKDAHDIAKGVENSIKENIGDVYDVMVHVEPRGNLEKDEKFGLTEEDIKPS